MKGFIKTIIPKDCGVCKFCNDEADWLGMLSKAECMVTGERVEVYYGETIPKSCPIKPMPQKKVPKGSELFNEYVRGWNECVEEMEDVHL